MRFLMRNRNKVFTTVTWEMVSVEASYGLEVLCVVHLYEPKVYINKMKELVEALFADGLL